jgi:transposase
VDLHVIETVTKTIGSLALAYPYLKQLGVADIIAGVTTTGKERDVATGTVVEVLVLNRLSLKPTPISKIDAWAHEQVIEEIYGVPAVAFNDDRIGRALDDIYPHLSTAWVKFVLAAAERYHLDLRQLHSDVTRVSFEGDYAVPPGDPPPMAITHGYTGHQDPTRKQVTVSLSVSADGAIPAWYEVADGNAADCRAYLVHLKAVQDLLHLDDPLIVGDSKLITRPNILGFCRANARFVGPTSLAATNRQTLEGLWEGGEAWQRLDLPTEGAPTTSGRYWGLETTETIDDPEQGKCYVLQRFFIQSLDDRRAARHQRAKDLAKAHRDLWTIRRRLRLPSYRQRALVERKVAVAIAKVAPYLTVQIDETDQGLTLSWRLNRHALAEEARFDGIYALLTNDTSPEASLHRVFHDYKGQPMVEGRFRALKAVPVQIRPLWLHQPKRIASLIFIVMIALFVFALIEREARRVVEESKTPFAGIRPDRRDHLPVTTTVLFEAFTSLTLVKQRLQVGDESHELIVPTTLHRVQVAVLDRLGLSKPDVYLRTVRTSHPL